MQYKSYTNFYNNKIFRILCIYVVSLTSKLKLSKASLYLLQKKTSPHSLSLNKLLMFLRWDFFSFYFWAKAHFFALFIFFCVLFVFFCGNLKTLTIERYIYFRVDNAAIKNYLKGYENLYQLRSMSKCTNFLLIFSFFLF